MKMQFRPPQIPTYSLEVTCCGFPKWEGTIFASFVVQKRRSQEAIHMLVAGVEYMALGEKYTSVRLRRGGRMASLGMEA